MVFDFKKAQKQFYKPTTSPSIITIPSMNFLSVRGQGNPNTPNGEYSSAITMLYTIAYTIRMSYKSDYSIPHFFEYIVPPLEGFWWQDGIQGVDYNRKDSFQWLSLIRLPDFIIPEHVEWAINRATQKKNSDFSKVQFFTYDEGLCVQCLHVGDYNNEPGTVAKMEQFAHNEGYVTDITDDRYHHEIYLNDFRKTETSRLKTILRHPIKIQK